MKKFLSNFADSLISRDQMKSVKGGCGNGGTAVCKDKNQDVIGSVSVQHCIDALCECTAVYGSEAQYAACY